MIEIIGDEDFKSKFEEKVAAGAEQRTVTVDAKGNIVGDTSALEPHILEQLSSPESQAQIRDMYRSSRYAKEPERPMKYIAEREDRRIFADTCPPGMSRKDWRKMGRMRIHRSRKAILKTQRSMTNGKR